MHAPNQTIEVRRKSWTEGILYLCEGSSERVRISPNPFPVFRRNVGNNLLPVLWKPLSEFHVEASIDIFVNNASVKRMGKTSLLKFGFRWTLLTVHVWKVSALSSMKCFAISVGTFQYQNWHFWYNNCFTKLPVNNKVEQRIRNSQWKRDIYSESPQIAYIKKKRYSLPKNTLISFYALNCYKSTEIVR